MTAHRLFRLRPTAVALFLLASSSCGGGSFTAGSAGGSGGVAEGGSAGAGQVVTDGGSAGVAGSDTDGGEGGAAGGEVAGTSSGGASSGGASSGGASSGGGGGGTVCATMTTVQSQANADAIITSGAPNLNFGGGDVANVGVGIMSEGLFRFSVAQLPLTAKLQGARLRLSYAPVATACGAACGSCAKIDAAGTLAAFFARSDWEEKTVTWNKPWSTPGAGLAGVDRSAVPAATAAHVIDHDQLFTMTASDLVALPTWRSSAGQLTFQLVPSNSAVLVAVTKEWATDNCVAPAEPPHVATLEIDYCP